jgi:hypothetical protein|tara:strand:+ start:547 stop:1275 length:729 start_codon:yes stop_codon:yes gene_type:complete
MKRYFIINHLGLGDHIICNALYRHYCDKGNTVIIPVKAHNTQAVQDMFSDKENAFVLSLNSGSPDEEMVSSSVEYASMGYELVRLGNFGSNFLVDQSTRYDHNFYNQAGVDFDERWNSFYAPSNQEREEEVYEFLCDKQEYVFLHEDIQRGFIVNRHYIDKKYKIVSPVSNGLNSENKFRFCDYRKVIENASEIHCIESSFCALIESLNIGKKRHAHRYCRPEASSNFCYEFTYRNDWEIII